MNKVLIITYYWPPSGGAGVQRWLKFAKYLPKYNWHPIILTVDPKYASYPQLDLSLDTEVKKSYEVYRTKTFEWYNIYKKLTKNEIPYGGFSNVQSQSLLQKISKFLRGNLFIPDPRKGWNKYALKKAKELIKKHSISNIITTSPPHSSQLIGLKLKKRFHVNWIADLRDPWTDIYYYSDLNHLNITSRINRSLERQVLEAADSIITVSVGVKKILQSKTKKHLNIDVISNGYDVDDFKIGFPSKLNDELTITYTGTISEKYDINTFIEVLRAIENEGDIKVKLRFVGSIPESIKLQLVAKLGPAYVSFIGYVPHQESIKYLLSSDLLLLVIPKTEQNEGIITGKIFEYLASKRPILCLGPVNGDAARIIQQCNSGETFDYSDFRSMHNYISSIKSETSKKYKFTSKKYDREALTLELSKVMNSLNRKAD